MNQNLVEECLYQTHCENYLIDLEILITSTTILLTLNVGRWATVSCFVIVLNDYNQLIWVFTSLMAIYL